MGETPCRAETIDVFGDYERDISTELTARIVRQLGIQISIWSRECKLGRFFDSEIAGQISVDL